MEEEGAKNTKWLALGFRFFHIGLCAFMCVTAVFSLMSDTDISLIAESRTLHFTSSNSSSAEDTDSIFVAIYVFIFAVILFVFEMGQFKTIVFIDNAYRANFGFIYKPLSKAIFIIFVGFLQFGLSASKAFRYSCGIIAIIDGLALAIVYCKDPALLIDAPEKYTPPALPSSTSIARSQEV